MILTVVVTSCYGDAFTCVNPYLPEVVQAHPDVIESRRRLGMEPVEIRDRETDDVEGDVELEGELEALIDSSSSSNSTDSADIDMEEERKTYYKVTGCLMGEICAFAIAMAFISSITVLLVTGLPLYLLGGSPFSLKLALGISGLWWIVWSIPALTWLPKPKQRKDDEMTWKMVGLELKKGWGVGG